MVTRILVVGDDRARVEFIVGILRRHGWIIGTADDGAEAVRQVETAKWDVVLMNVRLPKLDGLAALKLIRKINSNPPVILLAGGAEQGEMVEAYRSGADACLPSAVDEQDLVIAVREALERSGTVQARTAPVPTPIDAGSDTVDEAKKTKPLA